MTSERPRKSGPREQFLFVYGTLMRGAALHYLLRESPQVSFVGKGKIRAKLYRLRGEEYPGAIPSPDENRFVYGELYRLRSPSRILQRVDEAEGCDEGLFVRRSVDVEQDGKKLKAWTYFYAKSLEGAEPLPEGRFVPMRLSHK